MNYTESVAYIHSFPRLAKTGDHRRILRYYMHSAIRSNKGGIFT